MNSRVTSLPDLAYTKLSQSNFSSPTHPCQNSVIRPSACNSVSANNITPYAQIFLSHEISDISASSSSSSFSFRKEDGSLAMHVQRSARINIQQENITVNLSFSAEMLGLDNSAFTENNNQPLQFNFSFQMTDIQQSYSYKSRTIQTLRKTEDVLKDLAGAFSKMLNNRGDKNISVFLDSEAFQSLLQSSSPELILNIIGLLTTIQLMQNQNRNGEQETILISGKGKPYQDVEENFSFSAVQTNFEFNLTITPPQSSATASAELPDNAAPVAIPSACVDVQT